MKSLATIVAALTLGSFAIAADEKPAAPAGDKVRMSPEEVFKKLDTDNSGDVSLTEYKAGPRGQKDPAKAEEQYKKLDADNNGKLTADEFKAGRKGGPGGERKGKKGDAPAPK